MIDNQLSRLKVGDIAIVVSPHHRPCRVLVRKVGRSYIHAGDGKYDRDSGVDTDGLRKLRTREHHEEVVRRERIVEELCVMGIDAWRSPLSTETLARVLEVVEKDEHNAPIVAARSRK